MARIPLPSPPARPLTVSVCVHPRKRKKKSKSGSGSLRSTAIWVRSVFRRKTDLTPSFSNRHQKPLLLLPSAPPHEPFEARVVWAGRGVSGMGPRHASGGLGRTPNPGLAVCTGQRTGASGDQAPMDGFTASPASPHHPGSSTAPRSASALASAVAVAVAVALRFCLPQASALPPPAPDTMAVCRSPASRP